MATETARLRCSHCGARPARLAQRFCEYCGTALEAQDVLTAPFGDVASRFVELRRRVDPAQLRGPAPRTRRSSHLGETASLALFLLIFLVLVGGMSMGALAVFPPLVVATLLFGVLGVWTIGRRLLTFGVHASDPAERRPALVADERIQVVGRSTSETDTQYFATLQFEDGSRQELRTADEVAGHIAPGDLGVASIGAGQLRHFERFEV
jgi:hypothetical protein